MTLPEQARALAERLEGHAEQMRCVWGDLPVTRDLDAAAALLREPLDRETRISLVSVLTDRNRIALNALKSIAANTCCVGCGEAAKVAQSALDTLASLEGRDSK